MHWSVVFSRDGLCKRGHDVTDPANLYTFGGRQQCAACYRRRNRINKAKRRAKSGQQPRAEAQFWMPSNSATAPPTASETRTPAAKENG